MTNSKKYYWLKLKEDFFDSKLVKKIRKLAGGDTYCIIYQRMILSSMKNNGTLIFEGLEDDLISEIALELDETIENVKATVGILMSAGKIETLSENEFQMIDFQNMTGSETDYAKKKREYRAKTEVKKQNLIETKKDIVRQEIDIELEKEKEIDIELEKEIDKKNDFNSILENCSIELKIKFKEYIQYRKDIKKPLKTTRPLISLINGIGKKFIDENHLIKSIDFSMDNEYQGVFVDNQDIKKIEKEKTLEERAYEIEKMFEQGES